MGERVTADDQIDWRIVLVHDDFHEEHARMRRAQYTPRRLVSVPESNFSCE
jgi:hypothetical protein